jgi:multiphosphoryl transfer protein
LTPFSGTGETQDGHRVELLANVASPESVADAIAASAEGVGLFRTEFCFLDRDQAPSIDEQTVAYRAVLSAFGDHKVIVRTLDAGADKPLPFVTESSEINPALGIRGYRTARRRPEVLDDQLAAIALAAAAEAASVGVMAPMIDTVDEAADFVSRCSAHGLGYVGVMIETPAAALTAKEIFDVVDFVSLGTNDLAQYTMAADRLVGDLAALNDPWQPAVLRLVALVGIAAADAGKPVGVCGEAGADPLLATVLVGLGVSSLSMSPRALAGVADRLSRVTLAECQSASKLALAAGTALEARGAVQKFLGS